MSQYVYELRAKIRLADGTQLQKGSIITEHMMHRIMAEYAWISVRIKYIYGN